MHTEHCVVCSQPVHTYVLTAEKFRKRFTNELLEHMIEGVCWLYHLCCMSSMHLCYGMTCRPWAWVYIYYECMHSLRVCVCTYGWTCMCMCTCMHVCVCVCVCTCLHQCACMISVCVVSFRGVQKCGEEGEEVRKELEGWRGKVMWSCSCISTINIQYICVIVKCRV